MTPERKPWFGPKQVGISVGPRTWQGVAMILGLVLIAALIMHFVARP